MVIIIKNVIEYYYGFSNINLYKNKDNYNFTYDGYDYLFLFLNRYDYDFSEIDSIIKNYNEYDQLISNKNNNFITSYSNRNYVLIRKSKYKDLLENMIIKSSSNIVLTSIKNINKSNWVDLWSKKIDYVEYQLTHIQYQYENIMNSINYYIGMAENAIQYINNIVFKDNNELNVFVISHKRIIVNNFNNPLNIIVDYRSRDISEYLKYVFFAKDYDYIKIKKFLMELKLNEFELQLVYGRLLFPTFYFDVYDDVLLQKKEDYELKKIINRSVEYEDYLKNIYEIICEIKKIPEVSWI